MQGLVCKSRAALQPHKQAFAHDVESVSDLRSAVETIKPTALIGVSTQASSFTKPIIEAMARNNARPIIFPLSNPTDKSECTFLEAMEWTSGKVLFASGNIIVLQIFDALVNAILIHPDEYLSIYEACTDILHMISCVQDLPLTR